jgi:AraC-like DNA-binding protein
LAGAGPTSILPELRENDVLHATQARISHGWPSRFRTRFRDRLLAHRKRRAAGPCRGIRQRVQRLRRARRLVSPPAGTARRFCGADLQSGQRAAGRAVRDTRRSFGEGQGFFSGASATYVVTETDGGQSGAQIKFSLLGARLFLGLPLGEFGDALIDASEAFGRTATELRDRLAEARSQDERLNLLVRAAEPRLGSEDAIAPGLAFAFRRLSRADVRIADVAREVGMSREGFSKAFRREFGPSPKTFSRVRRFARTLRAREREPSLNGAALAAQCGYVDQAHMVHEFQEFAGGPPSALWRRELPDAGGFID